MHETMKNTHMPKFQIITNYVNMQTDTTILAQIGTTTMPEMETISCMHKIQNETNITIYVKKDREPQTKNTTHDQQHETMKMKMQWHIKPTIQRKNRANGSHRKHRSPRLGS